MKIATNTDRIFSRFDLKVEVTSRGARQISSDSVLQAVAESVVNGDEEKIGDVVRDALAHHTPKDIIDRGLIPGMDEVSRLWDAGTYFLPQVILSSDAMLAGISLCEDVLGQPMERRGKVVTHTAEGDIHDIAHVIINALLSAAGFEVVNLGSDVAVDDVVLACRIHQPLMVTGTAQLTTTMTAFPRIAEKLARENLTIPFACGGGAVSEEFATSFDFGIWGKEASQAVGMAEDALKGSSWREMRSKWNG